MGVDAEVDPDDPRYVDDPELRKTVRRFLNLMERVAVGVNAGVYDIRILNRICGLTTIQFYRRVEKVIARRREINGPTIYIDFEKLVERLQEVRAEPRVFTSRDPVSVHVPDFTGRQTRRANSSR